MNGWLNDITRLLDRVKFTIYTEIIIREIDRTGSWHWRKKSRFFRCLWWSLCVWYQLSAPSAVRCSRTDQNTGVLLSLVTRVLTMVRFVKELGLGEPSQVKRTSISCHSAFTKNYLVLVGFVIREPLNTRKAIVSFVELRRNSLGLVHKKKKLIGTGRLAGRQANGRSVLGAFHCFVWLVPSIASYTKERHERIRFWVSARRSSVCVFRTLAGYSYEFEFDWSYQEDRETENRAE